MMLHAVCYCIKIVPRSTKHETNVITLPTDEFDSCDDAWEFAKETLENFMPESIEIEERLTMLDDDNTENGFFFSTEKDLVNIFGYLYKNPQLIEKSGEINFEKRSMFSWKSVTERYVDMIQKL